MILKKSGCVSQNCQMISTITSFTDRSDNFFYRTRPHTKAVLIPIDLWRTGDYPQPGMAGRRTLWVGGVLKELKECWGVREGHVRWGLEVENKRGASTCTLSLLNRAWVIRVAPLRKFLLLISFTTMPKVC